MRLSKHKEGDPYLEGEVCPDCQWGYLEINHEGCRCGHPNSSPPCGHCTDNNLICHHCSLEISDRNPYESETTMSNDFTNTLNLLHAENGVTLIDVYWLNEQGMRSNKKHPYKVAAHLVDKLEPKQLVLLTMGDSVKNLGYRMGVVATEQSESAIDFTNIVHYQWVTSILDNTQAVKIKTNEEDLGTALARAEARKKMQAALGELGITSEVQNLLPNKASSEGDLEG